MLFETPSNDGGEGVSGPPASGSDVIAAAFQQGRVVDNPLARRYGLEQAYDKRIAAIFAATGQRVDNPARMAQPGLPDTTDVEQDFDSSRFSRQQQFRRRDPYAEFDGHLQRLATQHPDHVAVINPTRSPREDARETARNAERGLDDALARYDGPTGGGTLASLIGGAGASFTDPANLLGMAVGPMSTVGAGARAIAWNALKSGAANAAVEASFQPLIADWRREAGLEYGVSQFALNVGGAAALGFGLDAGIRGAIRGVQRTRGLVPKLDAGGGFVGWHTPEQALEAAALKNTISDVAQAAGGDPGAMRRLAQAMGRDGDPDVMAAINRYEMEMQTSPRHPALDPDDTDARFTQAVRSVLDDREPPPARAEPLPQGRDDFDPSPERQAEREAAARMLDDGEGTPIQAAIALRQHPDLAAGVSFASDHMQVARALSRLSDEAFDQVLDGAASPRHAALVGQLVPDPARHRSVLDALENAQPESLESARHMIAELTPPPELPSASVRLTGLDDPYGPQAKAQTDALEAMLSQRIEAARARLDAGGREVDPLDAALKADLDTSERFLAMRDLIEECKL